ncbi:MAG: Hsp33 family molecular chaperone HslO [Pseudomonadota bacterium]
MTTTEETGSAMGETPGASGGDDAILPFQLDRLDLRGGVVRLDKTLNQILDQHRYPGPVSALVGEAVLITALIGRSMKLRQRFSLQAKGDGAVSMIATDYFAPQEEGEPARLRAYAQFDADRVPEVASDPFSLLGEGLMAMTIDQGKHTTPYQGLTPLVGGGLASCAETYFAQSVQTATRFQLSLGQTAAPGESPRWRAGGVMLQHLPDFGEGATPPDAPSGGDGLLSAQDIADMGDQPDNWRRANMLLDTVETMELIGPHVTPERLLIRLFHEEQPRVYPAQTVVFGCTCSREKVVSLMAGYPETTVQDMVTEDGEIVADCQFCGAQYRFDLEEMLADRLAAQNLSRAG